MHRDIKPDNILLHSKDDKIYDVRVADFGFATLVAKEKLDKVVVCGTPGYICPEVLNGGFYSYKSDIFCAGCILFSNLTLQHFFEGHEYKKIMAANRRCSLEELDDRMLGWSDEIRDLVRMLMTKDPTKRPSARQALHHRFFEKDRIALDNSLELNKVLTKQQMEFDTISVHSGNERAKVRQSENFDLV